MTSQAAEKHPSAAFPSFLVIAAYLHVRLIPRNLSAPAQTPHPSGGSPVSGALHLGIFQQPAYQVFFSNLLGPFQDCVLRDALSLFPYFFGITGSNKCDAWFLSR